MATAGVLPPPSSARRPSFKPIIEAAGSKSTAKVGSSEFNPEKHLTFEPPSKVYKMADIGLSDETGVSTVAVSEPFPLFSPEAIRVMREEVLREEVMNNCNYSSNIAACQLRGFAPKYSPFVYEAWKNPKTLEIISRIAGVDLVPVMDFEIGHVNVSVKSEQEKERELANIREAKSRMADEGIAGCPWEDDKPIVGWHTDSYPFVCVLMLSDCSTMVGGETALRTGKGDVVRVRGPQEGCAVVLQGRYITHQALRALGATERITMVTSFRPRSPHARDDTELRTVRPISDLSELYYQFGEYRLEILEERIRSQLRKIRETRGAGKRFDTKAMKNFLTETEDFVSRTDAELIEDEKVQVGYIEEMKYENVKVEDTKAQEHPSKRSRVE
ncbi:hypothetical protein L228DRAFT_100083 [Xylona heveae TC161]|uniref:Fe2OG dioxygenase domain-containing protein n=1 Tax=Xylona heveae (strain CBS 132557 / TC161) TaxID=1328760 RepID=A0A161TF47_XYLHT|nr:hypothetical protein L228DRAFT_100083 [Xylona heveae TC161]KZF24607.1 hypothetical protein L228DRAFT_100083 [Xylona heveae TC161]